MKKTDFDDYATQYQNILAEQHRGFDANVDYFCEYKIKLALGFFKKMPGAILDYGCGVGRSIPYFKKYFPHATISGCDISEKSLEQARKNFSFAHFYKAETLPSGFDLIFLSGVLHHVAPVERVSLLAFLKSKLSPAGKIVIFEHNPFNPITRKLVNECIFDNDAVLLKLNETQSLIADMGAREIKSYYTLFFPGFLRWFRPLEPLLGWIPLGGQYVVCGEF